MPGIFDKLNLKDQPQIVVVDAPDSFEPEIDRLKGIKVLRKLEGARHVDFGLAFVTSRTGLDRVAKTLAAKARGDAIIWFAYPKGTSKMSSEISRDVGWDVIKAAGFDTVRIVAIDADWSALRFRRVEFIKSR